MRAKLALFEGNLWSFTPYDPKFVEALKGAIPAKQRWWEPELKLWRVDRAAGDALTGLLWRFFGGYAVVAPGELGLESVQHRLPAEQPYAVLHLQPTAPAELVRAAYKTLALLYHPDRGGDTAEMQAINAAYEALSKSN